MKLSNAIIKRILPVAGCLFFLLPLQAQNWDINTVRSINPEDPNSAFWETTSGSAYVFSVGIPIGTWIHGTVHNNKQTQHNAYAMIGSLAIASVITQTLKLTIDRPRPYQTYDDVYPHTYIDGESFPSGHTTIAFATATSLALEYKKWYITVPAYAWAAGVGYSRKYLGQHYPSDVIAGAVVGTGSAFLGHWLSNKIFRKK